MSKTELKYLDTSTLHSLRDNVATNIGRYRQDGFVDLITNKGWSINGHIEVDTSYFHKLDLQDKSSAGDARNSVLVWKALRNMTPALATEDRIWSRLSHVEGFQYSKARWLDTRKNDEELGDQIKAHFFASSLTRYRDDHTIGRLWWNAWVAIRLRGNEFESALELICKKADIRQALLERSLSFSRIPVGQAVLRGMERIPDTWSAERNFREFMIAVNLLGGGQLFEHMEAAKIDDFIDRCWSRAENALSLN